MPRPTYCRDCGERITEAPNAHLPGYCGPCSIPEQQAREQGRSVPRLRWILTRPDNDGPTPSEWDTTLNLPVTYRTRKEARQFGAPGPDERIERVEITGDPLNPTDFHFHARSQTLSLADLRRMAGRNP